MGDENQGHAARGAGLEQEIGDLPPGRAVEIAGRLVGDHQGRAGGEGTGNGDALLLAARQLTRIMGQALPEAHRAQLGLGAREGVPFARQLQGHGHVLERRHVGDEVEGLEHDADIATPKGGHLVLGQIRDVRAHHLDSARIDALQPREHHQKRRLARARWSHHACRHTARDLQAHPVEHVDGRSARAEVKIGVAQPDSGSVERRTSGGRNSGGRSSIGVARG